MFLPILRSLLLCVVLAFPQGCRSVSIPVVVEPTKKHVDASVMQECRGVVDVPHRALGYEEASRLWAKDRQALGDCRRGKHAAIVTIKALIR